MLALRDLPAIRAAPSVAITRELVRDAEEELRGATGATATRYSVTARRRTALECWRCHCYLVAGGCTYSRPFERFENAMAGR